MNQPSAEAAMMEWFHQLEAVDAENRAWLSGIVDAHGKDLAYLEDRVAIARGREQIYGTQFHLVDGVMLPKPIADPERVDERRAAVGLGTLAEYTEQIRQVYAK